MTILASKDAVSLNTDPNPWTVDGIHTPKKMVFGVVHNMSADIAYQPRAQFIPRTTHAANPILTSFRAYDHSDNVYGTHEYLFQLARHWSYWQSARIGTFPLDYTDPSGQATRAESEESGEDSVYWDIDAEIRAVLTSAGAIIHDDAEDDGAYTWEPGTGAATPIADRVQDMIAHAVRVLSRLDDWYEATGRGIA